MSSFLKFDFNNHFYIQGRFGKVVFFKIIVVSCIVEIVSYEYISYE